ncbi:Cyclopropane-fatty-acyl-phospholipid synthase [Methyloligella halotolerans]|uniref:Cyclopropane-fatty-acyl-phospholipid synthase n=1 Tax=Methyloligella halotolerans TaxID=1177755 RepID=A0A1E2S1N3_9HYPH|nr:cyclopropane-fatty-acyl-phospholipid synthase family protein [Methyloligella halotolerans]ODA68413.1 Cyclopropane-fatty-acyl-phospholipid synthase [Methyloligella halotolerans]
MLRPLDYALRNIVVRGHLKLIDPDGKSHEYGDPSAKTVIARIADRATERRIALNPGLNIGEAFADGRLTLEQGTIYDFLEAILQDLDPYEWPRWTRFIDSFRYITRWIQQYNPAPRAKRNIAHHYDIDGSIYDLFLDPDRQYSCAYFERPDQSLEDAQLAKKRHIAAKLDLQQGQKVLDIGSGWGGLALYLAQSAHVDVTGITLSEEQLKVSRERAEKSGLARSVDFQLIDYRALKGTFDRIVSVGMFEHVGVNHYRTFFRKVYELLADDGVAMIHSIGRFDGPGTTNQFIAKYIFPGGYIPALSEVFPPIEHERLISTDVEILRLHYAMTLRHWRQRFRASWHTLSERFGEKFCRVWEFYLAGSETAFRYQGLMVFQIQLSKNQDALPLTRDYIFETERDLRRDNAGDMKQPAGTAK